MRVLMINRSCPYDGTGGLRASLQARSDDAAYSEASRLQDPDRRIGVGWFRAFQPGGAAPISRFGPLVALAGPDTGFPRARPGQVWPWVQAVVAWVLRAAQTRSASMATAAAARAAPAAIRAICQPGMPPMTTVWAGTGTGAWCTGWWMCPGSGGGRWPEARAAGAAVANASRAPARAARAAARRRIRVMVSSRMWVVMDQEKSLRRRVAAARRAGELIGWCSRGGRARRARAARRWRAAARSSARVPGGPGGGAGQQCSDSPVSTLSRWTR